MVESITAQIVSPPGSRVVHKFLILLNVLTLFAPPARAAPPTAHHPGKWTHLVNWPHIQVHATIQPSDQAHTSILWWRGDEPGETPLHGGLRDWNPPDDAVVNAGTFTITPEYFGDRPIKSPNIDIFCGSNGHLPLAGRVLIAGGNQIGEIGLKHALVFDPEKLLLGGNPPDPWVTQPDMVERRWYGTNTALADGRTLVLSGSKYRQMAVYGGVDAAGAQDDQLRRFGVASEGSWDPLLTPTWTSGRPTEREGLALLPGLSGTYAISFGGRREQAGGAVYSNSVFRMDRENNDFTPDYLFKWSPQTNVAVEPQVGLPGPRLRRHGSRALGGRSIPLRHGWTRAAIRERPRAGLL